MAICKKLSSLKMASTSWNLLDKIGHNFKARFLSNRFFFSNYNDFFQLSCSVAKFRKKPYNFCLLSLQTFDWIKTIGK